MSKWTQFWDMNSGGGQKEKWAMIYIEAPEEEAKVIFYNRFGHNPDRVSCTCCGSDYSISEHKSLGQLTAYHRNCKYVGNKWVEKPDADYKNGGKVMSLAEYENQKDVLFIRAKDIKQSERVGDVPEQGYVWRD